MRPAGLAQPIFAGLVAGVTGFASSFALLIAGLRNVGATDDQAASGLLVLCVVPGLLTVVLSAVSRIPISIVWSTPAAALLLASDGTDDFRSAVGAFLLCGVLLVITGLWPWLARTVTRIPKPIASAMLAGILFPICLAPVTASVQEPLLALPIVLTWLVLARLAPRLAVPAAVVVTVVVVVISSSGVDLSGARMLPVLAPVVPGLDLAIVLGLGIPVYLVTMAGQNVPGFAVLRTFGYEHAPARAIFVSTGAGNLVAAPFGGISMNLAAMTAAMAAGPDAHPEREKRWVAAVTAGATLAVLGLLSGVATVLVAASPPILITAVAGLALLGALVSAVTAALEEPAHRLVAIVTFLVAVSGLSIAGIGSAFWALLVGGLVMLWFLPWRRKHHPESAAP
ncbi:benzoate/H(+) symporter BenE family transporter [Pseudolysinimonas yzui]|uniref:Benzoate transporter n=1 Tax=Pseudolysinimonas yzui TaxID=2708254 RepID=A0A8J3M1A1_9MICO|nr:benzoate/H(+) symporter BenE family transporter [Pseudolysinimonas yzui]GHF16931.1 benzoate transporter [Pseudolysinimonas yzui]